MCWTTWYRRCSGNWVFISQSPKSTSTILVNKICYHFSFLLLSFAKWNNIWLLLLENLQKFLDHALSGAIYVRIGTHLPRDMQYELVETFRNISQQIVWEHDDIKSNLPDNVMICNGIPSKIVLSHKNTAIFITEDDTNVIKQALHYGIPMVIVPFRNSEVNIIHFNYISPDSFFFKSLMKIHFPVTVAQHRSEYSLGKYVSDPSGWNQKGGASTKTQ